MIQLPSFSQYYLLSTVIPGLFNALAIVFAVQFRKTDCDAHIISSYEWLLIVISGIIVTLIFGMLIERPVSWLVRKMGKSESTGKGIFSSYDEFTAWRNKLMSKINPNEELKSNYLIGCVEKNIAEYYCFNNIIPGLIIAAVILGINICKSSSNASAALPWVVLCGIAILVLLVLAMRVMRTWLKELYSMLK